ncbi:MAG TPA: alanine dehydrogenase [Burkholderiales bacterium]|nr:alanine dehydrogenase [Burkholderiales bacterium]
MLIGVPREIKDQEYRVGLAPGGAYALGQRGHEVLVETGAGARVGFSDASYEAAGARIVRSAAEVWSAEMVVKVKELQEREYGLARRGQVLFAYLHLAPEPRLLDALLQAGVTGIAYETVTESGGGLPLLAPMSRIAGKLSIQFGAWALQTANGGSGVLLAGVPGVAPGRVTVIGAGAAGANAVRIAAGIGADVTVFDLNTAVLTHLEESYQGRVKTCYSEPLSLAEHVAAADLVIGATLTPGKLASKLISRVLLRRMRPGSVLVDIAIDQGGIAETSRPTSFSHPLYVEEGVLHYCVPNMPSAVARTATLALTQATLPYVLRLADAGASTALELDPGLRAGLQVYAGQLTHRGLAEDLRRPWAPYEAVAAGLRSA